MADEDKIQEAENFAGEDASEVGTPPTEPEVPPAEKPSEGLEEAEKPLKTEEEGSKQEEIKEKRPSRPERRIRELSQRLKEMSQQVGTMQTEGMPSGAIPSSEALSDVLGVPPPVEGQLPWKNEPAVYPGAELTPEEFEKAVASRAATIAELKVRQALAEKEAIERQKEAIRSFADDAERLVREESVLNKDSSEYDEVVDKAFSELVVKVNSDEAGRFVSKIAPSELWKQFSKALKRERSKGEETVTVKMAENAAKAVVSPTPKQTLSVSSEEELAEKLAKGEITAEEAEKLLPKAENW